MFVLPPLRPSVSSRCVLSVAPCSCPYLPLGKSSRCAGEEVFIITCCLGSWIEFLHLCPHSLSLGLLSDTLYLLNFTSLTLSTCNTSTYLSPSLPPLPPPPPLHHRWALLLLLLLPFSQALYRSYPFSEMANMFHENVLLLLRDCVIILCFPLPYFLLVFIFLLLSSSPLTCHHHSNAPSLTVILVALHAAPSSQSIRPKSPPCPLPCQMFCLCCNTNWILLAVSRSAVRRGSDATHPAAVWWLKDFLFGYKPSPHRCPACVISSSKAWLSAHRWASHRWPLFIDAHLHASV